MLLKTLDSNRKISNSMTEDFEVLRTEADIYIARAWIIPGLFGDFE